MFLDSHCHLTSAQLAPDFEGVLQRAQENQVTHFINIGDDLHASIAAREQVLAARKHGFNLWSTVGVHPQNAAHYNRDGEDATTQQIYGLADQAEVCAIGEIGLDFVYDETHSQYPGATRPVQEKVLCEQLEIAIATGLPVVLHNRDADERLVSIIKHYASRLKGGVFHCFGSPLEVAQQILDLGFHLGFTGLVTFKNAGAVREVARACPLERLLIETDSPYLAPVPYRGKTNEPGYLPKVAETIASLHNRSIEDIAAITTNNALELFNLRETTNAHE